MARYYRLQINEIFLTSDGLEDGKPCRFQIVGVEALRIGYSGTTDVSANGTPQTTAFETGTKGNLLTIKIAAISKDVLDEILTELNSAIENNDTLTLIGSGDLGDFDLEAVPKLPRPFRASGQFSTSIIKDVEIDLITAT